MSIVEIRVAGRYRLDGMIGSGLFGEVFEGRNVHSGEKVAIKLESQKCRFPQLGYEGRVLKNLQGGLGVPLAYWCGNDGDYTCLVMELMGEDLKKLLEHCKGKFSLKTSLMLADQLFSIFEYIHSRQIIHRDVKPENITMGGSSNFFQAHLIDFGLAKKFIKDEDEEHIPFKTGKSTLGSPIFASINNLQGNELSRRDDLESMLYCIIKFVAGYLPWEVDQEEMKGIPKSQLNNQILTKKQMFKNSSFWETARCNYSFIDSGRGSKLPGELKKIYEKIIELKFEEKPHYIEYRRLIKEAMIKESLEFDFVYDWILIPMEDQLIENAKEIDELLAGDTPFTKEEEERLNQMMKKYEEDPTFIDFKLDEIRKQNEKLDIVSAEDSGIEPERKGEEANAVVNNKKSKKKKKKGRKGKGEDCNLI